MQPRTSSVGDGIRVSTSTVPINSCGGTELDDLDSFRDVYIWGKFFSNGVSPDGIGTQIPSQIDVLIPKPLESNVILDVCHIATGAHHIAVVTKQGNVFTWGKDSGGRLGHGIDNDFVSPREVKFLEGTEFDFVACGEYHTGVISKCYELYTWGDGEHNVGLLGHGSEASHWMPKMVNGPLEGVEVVCVACGSWHSALATSDGKLFTFGDGAFGVLGHGDQESVCYPKEVKLLSGLKTIKVACGVWHTAAIMEVEFQSGSNASSGKLFTWGNGDKHCLGHGNTETYLQPTRVAPLTGYNFHQVACGHTMTVALTTSGHVFAMGGTEHGQLGNPVSAGKIPTLVQDKLLCEIVEEISCGAHHVVALTKKGELYTWGKGANGRLGHGDVEDRKSPTLVIAMKDRTIENISCGSNFTSCVCIHKWVSGADQTLCSGCRQAFGLTRKRHNCHHCGLVFCHACSTKRAFKAALTATPEKLHRVCDNCYVKLKVFDENGSSKLDKKPTTTTTTTTNNFINEKEKSNQAAIRPSRILLAPITEPVKYLEIKNNNPEDNGDSTSFVRASLVPSLTQLKDVAFPTSLSSIQTILKPIIPLSPPQTPTQTPPQTPTPNTSPGPKFTNTVRQSAARPASPRFYGSINDSLRRTNDILNQEVAKLQKQIQSLKDKSDMQDLEIKRLNKKATEASALAAVEYSNHRVTKEFVESTISQMKEVTDKLPGEISESRHLKDVLIRVKNFLKETSESETSSSPNLKTKPKVAPEIPTSNNDSSKFHAEDKVAATEAKPCQDELEQSKKSNLKHEQQNVDHDKQNLHEETDKSKLESTQQNIPSSDSITSEMHEHKLDEIVHVIEVIHCENRGNSIKESDGSKQEIENQKDRTLSSSSDISELLDDHRLDNAEVAGVDESQEQDHVFHECIGAQMNLENSEDGSRSSPPGNQGEVQVIEKFAHGVYVILMLQPDGTKIFKRVKFRYVYLSIFISVLFWNIFFNRVPQFHKIIVVYASRYRNIFLRFN
ncbi:hypothetical protein LR48_Vigan11g093500 [Vigna angularis]|uniref:FYVE-type domain-containing protein n=1 Tax=Phaseolus angularis TaxID=3914 RepID=A0A0L9VSQ7_PHAAN|nr:hypothetical protein LR48_Vigan11g093500 [Vigna angularis]